jgi:ATP-binding cassette subfamily B protein
MNKVSLREAAERQEQSERLTNAVLSFVEGIGVIKSYNLLGEKSEELTDNFQRSRNTSLAFEQKMTPWTMSLNILYGIGIAAIFGLSIVLEQRGALPLAYVLGVLLSGLVVSFMSSSRPRAAKSAKAVRMQGSSQLTGPQAQI